MQRDHLSGPDFLDAYADTEAAHGMHINAAEFRKRAQQWRADLAAKLEPTANDARRPIGTRDPRSLPLPGDRMHLPVQVADVGYGRGGFDIELHAIIDDAPAFDLTLLHDHTGAGDGVAQWLRGAIRVVAAADPQLVTAKVAA